MRSGITNKLEVLSQRIRNGDKKINPVVPPEYIKYGMLYNECLGKEQIPRITKEEKKTLKSKFGNNTESIGVQILLNDKLYELERVIWWGKWYETFSSVSSSVKQARTGIERLYTILIPIRNGLLSLMRKDKKYTAEDFEDWTKTVIIYDINDVVDANEETKQQGFIQQAQTGGVGDDMFIKAKNKLIKEIMKIKNNDTTGGIIQRDDILKLAEKCLKMRNVKSLTTVNKKSRKKKHSKHNTPNYEIVVRLVSDEDVKNALYAKQQQLVELIRPREYMRMGLLLDKQQQLDGLSRKARLDAFRLQAKTNADPRRHKQLKKVLAHHEENRQVLQLQTRIRHAQEAQMRQAQEAQMRQAQAQAEQEEQIRQAQAEAEASRQRAEYELERQRYYQEQRGIRTGERGFGYKPLGFIKKPIINPLKPTQPQQSAQKPNAPNIGKSDLRDIWEKAFKAHEEQVEREAQQQAEQSQPAQKPKSKSPPKAQAAQKSKSKSPPGAATRATAATATHPIFASQDDSNLGSLEMWEAISSNTQLKWDNYTGIKGIVGNNDNIVASVMLFLYLRDNLKDTDAIENLKNVKGHFGYSSIDVLITGFKRLVFNNAYASIGDEFFKIKDAGSKVNSILRMTLLGQRLNRVFFFLAKYHNCSYVVGYKRTRGDGYNFANEIGLTDEEFKEMMEKSGTDIPNEIKKLHRTTLLKFHSDKKNDIPSKTDTYEFTKLDGTVVKIERESVDTNKGSDRDYAMKRYIEIYTKFKKWYDEYKTDRNPLSYINEARQYFTPMVNNEIDWDKYDNGELHDIRYKEWFGI